MSSIWAAVVPESKKAVSYQFTFIATVNMIARDCVLYIRCYSFLSISVSPLQVDKYLPGIIDDLSQNLNSHLWRNRQARYVSC